jgi:hypothetical protein
MSDGHQCPGPGCRQYIPRRLLACGSHWRQVPEEFQSAVYRAWNSGAGAGTVAHADAMAAAIIFMRPLKGS